MEAPNLHPVICSLLNEAATELDDLALECSDASEYLVQGQMLAALGNPGRLEASHESRHDCDSCSASLARESAARRSTLTHK